MRDADLNSRLAAKLEQFVHSLGQEREEGDAIAFECGARVFLWGPKRGIVEINGEDATLIDLAQSVLGLTPETSVKFCEWWLSDIEEEEEENLSIPEMSAAVPTEPAAVAIPSNAVESEQKSITLAEAQAIAESIVGPVQWRGDDGLCRCPGEGLTGGMLFPAALTSACCGKALLSPR